MLIYEHGSKIYIRRAALCESGHHFGGVTLEQSAEYMYAPHLLSGHCRLHAEEWGAFLLLSGKNVQAGNFACQMKS